MGKIFGKYIIEKGLVSRINKKHLKLNNRKITQEQAKDLLDISLKKIYSKYMKRCPVLLGTRVTQIKTTGRYQFIPTYNGYNQKTGNSKHGGNMEKWWPSYLSLTK
jgi:hypothetical protein